MQDLGHQCVDLNIIDVPSAFPEGGKDLCRNVGRKESWG